MSSAVRTIIVIILAIIAVLGILQTIFPEQAWKIRKGIWYKDAEPGDLAIIMTRISGIVTVILCVFFYILTLGI